MRTPEFKWHLLSFRSLTYSMTVYYEPKWDMYKKGPRFKLGTHKYLFTSYVLIYVIHIFKALELKVKGDFNIGLIQLCKLLPKK